jgi:hypothetical protein
MTVDSQRYVNASQTAVFEIEVVQGSAYSGQDTINQDLQDHPDARQVTVGGHAAWLLPAGSYSGLTEVEWAVGSALVRVTGNDVDESTVAQIADHLGVTT